MANGATSASATDGSTSDIARRMGETPVNLPKVTSTVGRGANLDVIGESHNRLKDGSAIVHLQDGTPDGHSHRDHRGTKRVPIYDAQGNLAGIRRVAITGPSDGNAAMRKTSDGPDDHRGHRGDTN